MNTQIQATAAYTQAMSVFSARRQFIDVAVAGVTTCKIDGYSEGGSAAPALAWASPAAI